jgi:hypothetical protein
MKKFSGVLDAHGDARRLIAAAQLAPGPRIPLPRCVPRHSEITESMMASVRAEAVAEILWELKRMEKLATWTDVAGRAGFKAGVAGKNLMTCMDTVRRDWPHLQWWRAVPDNAQLSEQAEQVACLRSAGFALEPVEEGKPIVKIVDHETHIFSWEAAAATA